ncbi:hypothetical protein POTOM_058235 [Populus tomentosa]|uniref:Uncharacterized protein n=1 Tax=Populus tomentosa TaxID=118781 RepID=A0A8X7XVE0_POPTO|nr:hypothetical protein POTOM_058235 [Populus tomentosa]
MDLMILFEHPSFGSKASSPIIILGTLLALVAGFYYKLKNSKLAGKNLPPGSLGFPLVGESISLVRAQKRDKIDEWMWKRIDKFGPVFKTSIFGTKTVVLTGQAGNRFLFSGGDGISYKQPKTIASILGKYSLFEISGSRHKLIRGAIVGFLKPERIQKIVGEINSLVQQQLSKELDGVDSVKIVPFMKRIAFNITCNIFFGIPDGKEKDTLFEEFSVAVKGSWAVPLDIPGTVFHRAMQARASLCKILSRIIDERRRQMEEGTVDVNENIIYSFLSLRDENDEPLIEEEILDMVLSLIMASHDSTTILLCLLVRLLSRDAEIYNKVLEEQREVIKVKGGSDGKITWSEIQMMKYSWRVAQEIMRFYPPIFGNFRQITKDVEFDGFDIPKGWQVLWVASGTHMDKSIFEDPEKFEPSRFDNSSKTFPPYTYIPFGAGLRICPGADFVRIESMLVIHHFITKYQWKEIIPDEPIIRDPMPYPAMGLPVKFYPRNGDLAIPGNDI